MVRLKNRVRSALTRHGLHGLVRLLIYNIGHQFRRLRRGDRDKLGSDPFDLLYGSETSTIREVGTLDVESANVRHAVRYQPSSADLVRNAFEQLQLDLTEFTFIDFGSGKGRVLLLAAEYPFSQVIGVEFSRELNDIAQQNIEKMPARLKRAGRVSSVWCDAAKFDPIPTSFATSIIRSVPPSWPRSPQNWRHRLGVTVRSYSTSMPGIPKSSKTQRVSGGSETTRL